VSLTVDFPLGTDGWGSLFSAINTAGKYVSMDLSACTMEGTEFTIYPDSTIGHGGNIVSLVFPDAAKSINQTNPYADNFPALKSVSASAVETVGSSAFAFCTALTEVDLPAATSIESNAFRLCEALASVDLPAAMSIGTEAFYGCTTLTSVRLGTNVPTLGTGIFVGIEGPKTVTVRVPSGVTEWADKIGTTYTGNGDGDDDGEEPDVNWGNGFRGGGWTGSAFVDGNNINTDITLNIVAQ
jgi:hypothetical protein